MSDVDPNLAAAAQWLDRDMERYLHEAKLGWADLALVFRIEERLAATAHSRARETPLGCRPINLDLAKALFTLNSWLVVGIILEQSNRDNYPFGAAAVVHTPGSTGVLG